jgi:hypothetical protein
MGVAISEHPKLGKQKTGQIGLIEKAKLWDGVFESRN